MRVLGIWCFIVFHLVSDIAGEGFEGWHENVGIKNAEKIKQAEDAELQASRIVGGVIAPINFHPYLAGLVIDVVGFNSPSACGGSLLTSSRVLTAAHCWFDGRAQAWFVTVVLGSQFLFHGGLRIPAAAIALHPKYNFRTFANDIAMLHLAQSVRYTSAIKPIPLPHGHLLKMDLSGNWAMAAGYGRYSDATIPTTNTMARNVFLQLISLEQCRAAYGSIVLNSNICTSGEGGVGICRGDSGGPLTVNYMGQEVLIGVSSFVAYDGCELGHPSAFASVPAFLGWIKANL